MEASVEAVVHTCTTSAEMGPVQPSVEASMVAGSTDASVEVVAIVAPSTNCTEAFPAGT